MVNASDSGGENENKTVFGGCSWAYVWQSEISAVLETFVSLGFNTLDIVTVPPHPWPSLYDAEKRKALRNTSEALKISIESLNVPSTDVNLCSVNPDARAFSVDQIAKVIDLAGDIGAGNVTFVPGRRLNFNAPSQKLVTQWLDECLDALDAKADQAGVNLLVETHPMSCLPKVKDLAAYFDSRSFGKTGIALDVTNVKFVGEDPAQSIRDFACWIKQIHLSDAVEGKWEHKPIGEGNVDFRSIRDAVKKHKNEVTCILEIISDEPDAAFSASLSNLRQLHWS